MSAPVHTIEATLAVERAELSKVESRVRVIERDLETARLEVEARKLIVAEHEAALMILNPPAPEPEPTPEPEPEPTPEPEPQPEPSPEPEPVPTSEPEAPVEEVAP